MTTPKKDYVCVGLFYLLMTSKSLGPSGDAGGQQLALANGNSNANAGTATNKYDVS